jgi:AcrR family transcriptional regulator
MTPRARTRGTVSSVPVRSRAGGTEGGASGHVADIQRARLVAGAVRTLDELGYTRTTVTDITRSARVSRRTFYQLFDGRDDCLVAVLDSTVERVRVQIAQTDLTGAPWRERVRGGLYAILAFLDREPELARVCVVQCARAGQQVLECRERIARELASVIDEGRGESARAADCPPLTAEGLVGAVASIVHGRLSRNEQEPLSTLAGELMSMIVLPYQGTAVARRERTRTQPATSPRAVGGDEMAATAHGDPLDGIPMRLTYRTVCVLEAIAEHPGVSNRTVRRRAGIPDEGQCSKLLSRLERLGLLHNTGQGHTRGESNAWRLTPRGLQLAQTIRAHAGETGAIA